LPPLLVKKHSALLVIAEDVSNSSINGSCRHLQPLPSLENVAGSFLIHPSPLLKEKRNAVTPALSQEGLHPILPPAPQNRSTHFRRLDLSVLAESPDSSASGRFIWRLLPSPSPFAVQRSGGRYRMSHPRGSTQNYFYFSCLTLVARFFRFRCRFPLSEPVPRAGSFDWYRGSGNKVVNLDA